MPTRATAQPTTRPSPIDASAVDWVSKPTEEWLQINLTNLGIFRNAPFLTGASAFLIRLDDEVYIATARHLIGPAGGIEPAIPLTEFDARLRLWLVFPRTDEASAVEAGRLAVPIKEQAGNDWLMLSLKPNQQLPAHPLLPAAEPIKVGDTVFLIGVPYTERERKQNVYRGTVTDREGKWFAYRLDTPVMLNGFSGAPIVNERGSAVGVMGIWFKRERDEEGNDLFGGGQDVNALLSRRNEGVSP